MNLRFRQRNAYAQHTTATILQNADRDQHRTVAYASRMSNFFVACVENPVRYLAQWAVTPERELFIE